MYQVITEYYDRPADYSPQFADADADADAARTLYAHEAAHLYEGQIKQVLLTYQGVVVALAKHDKEQNPMTRDERDHLVDDAVYAVVNTFATRSVTLPEEEMFALNDYLTAVLRSIDGGRKE